MNKQERIEKAVALFKEGYNCSQSVVAAYADLYGFTPEQAPVSYTHLKLPTTSRV